MKKNYSILLLSLLGTVFNLTAQQLTLTTSKTSIAEGESFTITATLSAPLSGDLYIPFTSKGSATIGGDFGTNASTSILTVAGGNGNGSAANQLSVPRKVMADEAGNIYVLENNCVSKWAPNASSGTKIITNIYSTPTMFVDKAGNIYLANNSNYSIEKWEPGASSGSIVAGGNGMGSNANQWSTFVNIFVDKSKNIYIVDSNNNRVQKWGVGATTGVTVAGGNGAGSNLNQLNIPKSVFVDDNGNVFVCDSNNSRIQKWIPGEQSGTTFLSSTPENMFMLGNNIEDLQMDPSGKIYLMSSNYTYPGSKAITKWDPITKNGIVLAGNTPSGSTTNQLDSPQGYFLDPNGNLYIADTNNHRVQKYNYNNILIKAGETTAQLVVSTNIDIIEEPTEQITIKIENVPNVTLNSASELQIELTDNTNTPIAESKTVNTAQNKRETIALSGTAEGNVTLDYKITKLPLNGTLYQTTDGAALGNAISAVPTLITNPEHKVIFVPTWTINGATTDEFAFSVNNGNIPNLTDGIVSINISQVPYPTLNVVASKTSIAEGENSTITATLSAPLPNDIYIPFTSNGTALIDVDFATNANTAFTTVAGGNGSGSATNQLSSPRKVAVDAAGNTYVLENNCVSKWAPNATSGTKIITNLSYPTAMFVDKDGTVYIGNNNGNLSVEKWIVGASSGVVVAKGNNTGGGANQLSDFNNFYVDKANSIYIVDSNSSTVKKWSEGATSAVTVAGGNGMGRDPNQLSTPNSVFVDDNGNVFVCDSGNYRIQKWAPGATSGTTILFSTAYNMLGNSLEGLQMDSAGNIYLMSSNYGYPNSIKTITKWDPVTNKGIVVAGNKQPGTATNQLDSPQGYFLDSKGNLYIADTNNHRVQKYSYNNILIKAGETTAQLEVNATTDVLEEPTEQITLKIENIPNVTLNSASELQIELTDNTNTPIAESKTVNTAQNKNETIALSGTAEGNVTLDYKITKLPLNGTLYQTTDGVALGNAISSIPTPVTNPEHKVIFVPNWTVVRSSTDEFTYSVNNGNISNQTDGVISINISQVAFPTLNVVASKTTIAEHEKATITATLSAALPNDIYIPFESKGTAAINSDFITNGSGVISTVAGGNGQGINPNQLYNPSQIFIDITGNLYINDRANYRIQKWAPGATQGTTVAGGNGQGSNANQLYGPTKIYVDITGNVYVLDTYLGQVNRIQKWTPGATEGITVAGGNSEGSNANQLMNPSDFQLDDNGNIYICDRGNNRVQKWTPGASTGTTVAGGNGSGNNANQLNYPNRIFVDKTGNIIVSDNNGIKKWIASASIGTTLVYSPSIKGFYVDSSGNIYYNSDYNYQIQKWTSSTSAVTTVAGGNGWGSNVNQVESIVDFFVDDAENVYLLDSYNVSRVMKWAKGSKTGETIAGGIIKGSDANQLNSPQSFLMDISGNIFISDGGNNRIQKYNNRSILIKAGETTGQLVVSGVEDNLENEGTEKIELKFGAVPRTTFAASDAINIDLLDNTRTLTLQANSPFIGLEDGAVSWGDYDKDGDQDVAIMGTGNSGAMTKIYRNDKGDFIDTNQNFAKLYDGDISWVDINKDGWIDLVVSGITGNTPKTVVYLNTQGKYFTESNVFNLPQLFSSKMAWGDLDNDGDTDLVISGIDSLNNYVFKMMVNENNKIFIEDPDFSKQYSGFTDGDIKIADIDLDGDNDIIYNGQLKSGTPTGQIIYNSYIKTTNNNNYYPGYNNITLKNSAIEIAKIKPSQNNLTYITSGLDSSNNPQLYTNNMLAGNGGAGSESQYPKLKNGDIAVADFNNDGINDILFTGENTVATGVTKLYTQDSAGNFTESPIVLEGMRNSTANWVDYDGDGDLDLFLTGHSSTGGIKSLLYVSEIANKKNSAPAKVTGLVMTDLGNGTVKLKWDVPTDDFSTNLGYEIRIGTTPGGSELSCVDSNLQTGARLITNPATVYTNFYETQLNPGRYYWSVQAVDTGLKGGLFSDESSFTLTYDWKTLNQGGIIDRTIQGSSAPIIKLADLDNDNDMDLIYADSSYNLNNKIMKFNGKQLLTDSWIGSWGMITTVEIGDLNGDGKADILSAQNGGSLLINLSNATGSTQKTVDAAGLFKPKMRIVDINNDGQPEILVLGISTNNSSGFPKLWIYNYDKTTSTFSKTDASSQIEGLKDASFDLGDFDNDQDIDLIISGFNPDEGLKGIIYENITTLGGDFTLKKTENNLVAVKNGTTNFVDFDGDGDLDAVFTGENFSNNEVFEIYMNKVNEKVLTWPKLETNLTPIRNGKIDLGDFNGDGFSDLLYSGLSGGSGKITKLSEYVPNELTFKESAFDVSDIINAEVEFGDIDGDKDLDFIITGESKATAGTYIFRTYMNYRNDSAKVLSQTRRSSSSAGNDKPTAPTLNDVPVTKLSNTSAKSGTYPVELSWNVATDDNTPSSGLTYAIKIGTTSGGEQIMAANSNTDGTRKISGKGNAEHSTKWRLSLPAGKYYWSVQAIDASFAGSEFSKTSSFEIKADGVLSNPSFNKELNLNVVVTPNPTTNLVTVFVPEKLEIEKLELYDFLGRLITSATKNTISLQNLAKGEYILKIHTSSGVTSKKIIKK